MHPIMHPTMLLTNARIYTQDAERPTARAVALAGNRILAAVRWVVPGTKTANT